MQALPIVDRELRVAARRRSTFLIRVGVVLVALLIALPILFFGYMAGGGSRAGSTAFTIMVFYCMAMCCLAGVLISADCISSEKREGTLGLLFLTDLKGYDVVLGKFTALGLHTMYGLLAVFPALALPILLGAVTGAEFWRVALALANLLFVSLAIGMTGSTLNREASKAVGTTIVLLLFALVLLPLSAAAAQAMGWPRTLSWLPLLSPWSAYSWARAGVYPAHVQEFWISLGLSHALGWLLLITASVVLPRTWRDQGPRAGQAGWWRRNVAARWSRIFCVRRLPEMKEQNPLLWLMGDRSALRVLAWILAGAWGLIVCGTYLATGPTGAIALAVSGGIALVLIFALLFLEHTCRFWVEGREAGSLETLLATPLTSKAILSTHWASLRRHFMGPILAATAFSLLPPMLALAGDLSQSRMDGSSLVGIAFGLFAVCVSLCYIFALFLAIGWTGMWLSLRMRRPQYASAMTLLLILLPHLFCYYGIGVVLVLIFLPMSKLQFGLRDLILQQYGRARSPLSGEV